MSSSPDPTGSREALQGQGLQKKFKHLRELLRELNELVQDIEEQIFGDDDKDKQHHQQ